MGYSDNDYIHGFMVFDESLGEMVLISVEWADQAVAWYGKNPSVMSGSEFATTTIRMHAERPDIIYRLSFLKDRKYYVASQSKDAQSQ
jgi:hypothetical protein